MSNKLIMVVETMGFRAYEFGWELHTGVRYVEAKDSNDLELRSTIRFYSNFRSLMRGLSDQYIKDASTLDELAEMLGTMKEIVEKLIKERG